VSCTSDILLLLHEILYSCIVCGKLEADGCAPVVAMRLFVNGVGNGDVRVSRACEGYVRGLHTVVSRGGFTWVNEKREEVEAGDVFGGMGVMDPFKALVRPEAVALTVNVEKDESLKEVTVENQAVEVEEEVVDIKDALVMPNLEPLGTKRDSSAPVEDEIPMPKKQKKLVPEPKKEVKETSDSEDEDINMAIVLDSDSE
jgi:hypothetical protein